MLTKILSHCSPSENPWFVPAIILLMHEFSTRIPLHL